MPYISQNNRKKFKNKFLPLRTKIDNVGELNYVITKICLEYLDKQGEKYKTYNDIIGVLECAKLEMYRKKVSVYEEKKIIENGDLD